MRRILISIFGVFMIFSAFGVGENIPTSKSYVDAEITQKQDKIAANDGSPQVLTNTGTAGEYGTKGIYDANGAYATQTQNLVDATTMNAGVQNAINSEFQCIEWVNPNDHSSDCLLMDVFGTPTQQILPTGYTALEYIESTGTQWIDTEIIGNQDTKVDITFRATGRTSDFMIFGDRVSASSNAIGIWARSGSLGSAFRIGFGSSGGYTGANATTQKYHVNLSKRGAYLNGSFVWNPNVQNNFSTPSSLKLFALVHQNGGNQAQSALQVFNFALYSGATLIRNFIPARRNSDGVLGMYDTVTNSFFTNSGTGEFIAGPVVNLYLPSGN